MLICEQESTLTKDGFKQECQSNSGEKKVLYLIFSKKPYVLSINHGFLNELWTLNGTSLYRDFFENLKYNTIVQSILKIVLYCVVPIRALKLTQLSFRTLEKIEFLMNNFRKDGQIMGFF